ncbi:hypothetical protein [Stackebrandtia soli]|uniref:hypothetical protein n=1 Tax=Stackebrandtia soli TaxID=1892856 RepID=UPI0039E9F7C9
MTQDAVWRNDGWVHFTLTVGGDDPRPVTDPTDIVEAVDQLSVDGWRFAILGRAQEEFVQAFINDDDSTFTIEYRDGSGAQHFRATEPVRRAKVVEVFRSYFAADDRWRTELDWAQVSV